MSIRIDLAGDYTWYTSRDTIKGTAFLETRSSLEITNVKISLCGISHTALTRIHDVGQKFTDHVEDISAFLHIDKQLFPPMNERNGTKYTLRPGVHSWPFEFDVPSTTSGVTPHPLPPSFSDLDPDMVSIRYHLELSYERVSSSSAILGTSFKSIKHYLEFLPSDDRWVDRVPTYGSKSTHNARVVSNVMSVSGLFSRLISTLAHDKAPVCIDTGEFTLRTELLLIPGMKFTWLLEAHDISEEEKLFITSLKVVLVARSHIRAKNIDKDVTHSLVLFEQSQLNVRSGDITSQMQAPALKIPEYVPPSFRTSNIKRDYQLVFKIKWSHVPGSVLTHKSQLEHNVYVRSGINTLPNYETGEVYRPSRGFPQAKWYYK